MQIEWDENKNQSNKVKHKLSFETASMVFDDPLHVSILDRIESGEERWQTIGIVGAFVVIVVAHTIHENGDSLKIRIISARKAGTQERKRYETGTF